MAKETGWEIEENGYQKGETRIPVKNEITTDGEIDVYSIDFVPSIIKINGYDELENTVEEYAKKYKGLIFEEKDLKDAKSIRAELNGVFNSMDSKRKEIKKEFTQPLKDFENEMKKLNDKIQEVIKPIDDAVKEIEQKQRDEKQAEIESKVEGLLEGKSEWIKENFVFDPKWQNKTFTMKKVAEKVAEQIEQLEKEEQAKLQQVTIIENYCSVLELEPTGWIQLLDSGRTATEIMAMIDKEIKEMRANRIAEKEKAELIANRKLEQQSLESEENQTIESIASEPEIDGMDFMIDDLNFEPEKHTIVLELTGTIDDLKAIKGIMDELGIITRTI